MSHIPPQELRGIGKPVRRDPASWITQARKAPVRTDTAFYGRRRDSSTELSDEVPHLVFPRQGLRDSRPISFHAEYAEEPQSTVVFTAPRKKNRKSLHAKEMPELPVGTIIVVPEESRREPRPISVHAQTPELPEGTVGIIVSPEKSRRERPEGSTRWRPQKGRDDAYWIAELPKSQVRSVKPRTGASRGVQQLRTRFLQRDDDEEQTPAKKKGNGGKKGAKHSSKHGRRAG